jgi:phosphate transport system protein
MREHSDRTYARQLQELRARLLYMGGQVEQMMADATQALRTRDLELAARVIEQDASVDDEERRIDRRCLRILALRQPMARDLRFVTRAMKMVTDLERIADLAVSIARRVSRMHIELSPPEKNLPGLVHVVQSMVGDAIDAFVRGDAALARAVIAQDSVVDLRFHAFWRATLTWMMEDGACVAPGVELQSVGKRLERMADHATNLAEQVVFVVEGTDLRHQRRST